MKRLALVGLLTVLAVILVVGASRPNLLVQAMAAAV